jgi:hypothetical protein
MARYKHIDTNPRFLPVDLARQLLPGTFEHALNHLKWLNRFTLRGRKKVEGQWKLYCLVRNIEKLAHHGYAQ